MNLSQAKKDIRAYRSKVAILKKKGLIKSSIDARSHKPTSYMLTQIKRFQEIIDGKAIAVKTPTRKIAKEYSDLKDVKFDRVIMRTQSGEKGRYTKDGIKVNRKSSFKGLEDTIEVLTPRSPSTLPSLPRKKGKTYKYAIPFKRGDQIERQFFSSEEMLLSFISGYENIGLSGKPRFENIRGYVQILETSDNEKTINKRGKTKGLQTKKRGNKSKGKTTNKRRTKRAKKGSKK